jgi:hypothetical protein
MDFNTLPVAKLLGFAKKEQLVAFGIKVPDLYNKIKTFYESSMTLVQAEIRRMMGTFNITLFMQHFEQAKHMDKAEIARKSKEAAEQMIEQELERRLNERMNHPEPSQQHKPIDISDTESVDLFPLNEIVETQRRKIAELQDTLKTKNETIIRLNRKIAWIEEKYRLLQMKFYRK